MLRKQKFTKFYIMANGGGNDKLTFCHYYHLARYYSNSKVIAEYIPVLLGMARHRRKAKAKCKSKVSHEVVRCSPRKKRK